jgi:malonyl-CoA decarboxylase
VFIEIALTRGMTATGAAAHRSGVADSAMRPRPTARCSIRSPTARKGLRGVSFGNFPDQAGGGRSGPRPSALKTFATLSPMPGFCEWLAQNGDGRVRSRSSTPCWPVSTTRPCQTLAGVSAGPARRDYVTRCRVPAARQA